MQKIDVTGKLCPEPLIITRRAIKTAAKGESFEVVLDNDIATCNLEDLLRELKLEYKRVDDGARSTLYFALDGATLEIKEESVNCPIPQSEPKGDYIVVIRSECMGSSDDLGTILMRGFINSISEQDILPKTVILYNSGVLVATEGRDTAETMKTLQERGVDIVI